MNTLKDKSTSPFQELIELMQRLRSKDGCPWDKEQNHASLKPHLVEETYEVIDAIDSGDPDKLKEELADLFFILFFTAKLQRKRANSISAAL